MTRERRENEKTIEANVVQDNSNMSDYVLTPSNDSSLKNNWIINMNCSFYIAIKVFQVQIC